MIIRNSAKCVGCGDEIESKTRHDFVTCSCGNGSVDGGHDYLRRAWHGDGPGYKDTSLEEQFPTVDTLIERLRNVHRPDECLHETCTIHNPTDHFMKHWMLDWEDGIVRICPHGESHPDPDSPRARREHFGCDGCCFPSAVAA